MPGADLSASRPAPAAGLSASIPVPAADLSAHLVVRVDVWGVPTRSIPGALVAMARDRGIRRRAGVSFAKLLGTGDGRTFTARDADVRHWALVTSCADAEVADDLDADPVLRRWANRSEEHLRLLLTPLAARGRWSGSEPFGSPERRAWGGPVVAITRARLRPTRMHRFYAAVPPVSASLHAGAVTPDGAVGTDGSGGTAASDPLLAIGIGEAPVGLQGTLSVWSGSAALTAWAYRQPEHLAAVRATPVQSWYAEELFARFGLLAASGTFEGRPLAVDL